MCISNFIRGYIKVFLIQIFTDCHTYWVDAVNANDKKHIKK